MGTEHGFQQFIKALRITSRGTNRYLQVAHDAAERAKHLGKTRKDVDTEWYNIKYYDDTNLFHHELAKLKDWLKDCITKEEYHAFCKEFDLYDDDLDVKDFQRGPQGLANIFLRHCNKDDHKIVLSMSTDCNTRVLTESTYMPELSQWYSKAYRSEESILKFIAGKLESIVRDMWYCEFEAKHKLSSKQSRAETIARFKQRDLAFAPDKLKTSVMPLIFAGFAAAAKQAANY